MTLFKTLFSPIKNGDDVTTQFISVVATVALIGGAIIILVMLANIFFPAKLERAKIIVHDQQTFAKLQAKHGKGNTGVVVYEEGGKAWYYKDGKKIAFK